jgi:hypothetical protein
MERAYLPDKCAGVIDAGQDMYCADIYLGLVLEQKKEVFDLATNHTSDKGCEGSYLPTVALVLAVAVAISW